MMSQLHRDHIDWDATVYTAAFLPYSEKRRRVVAQAARIGEYYSRVSSLDFNLWSLWLAMCHRL